VDASVRVEGDDRAGVERLVRYFARPRLALERLHALGDSVPLVSEDPRLLYRLPWPDLQGRIALVLPPLELLGRLSLLIPPPRVRRTATTVFSRSTLGSGRKSLPSAGALRDINRTNRPLPSSHRSVLSP
jgi:hypothetical protein